MANCVKKKIFFLVFCLASVTQGMYSTYFVSILTTIERIYQIQSKTAGAIMSATEIGQILGSLLIAYYGGKGNKPKWIAACMTLTAIAALISTSPHFLLLNSAPPPPPPSPSLSVAAAATTTTTTTIVSATNYTTVAAIRHQGPMLGSTLVIFFVCLLAIGFGSTAITTLGIPFIDDIVSREESPLYLGLTIGLKIFGPALGFLLGSFCIGLDVNLFTTDHYDHVASLNTSAPFGETSFSSSSNAFLSQAQEFNGVGAWWLGLIIISLPLLILAIPMYYLSHHVNSSSMQNSDSESHENDFEGITYQAAEDHDIGGSRDFQPHVLAIHDLDVTSNRTCYSDVDSSSREVLAREVVISHSSASTAAARSAQQFCHYNFGKNITLEQPIITRDSILSGDTKSKQQDQTDNHGWRTGCVVVNHFGGLESTSFTNDEAKSLHSSYSTSSSSSSTSTPPSPTSSSSNQTRQSSSLSPTTMNNLSSTLSRLIKNKLLLLRLLSGILHILPIAGFYTFFPKYLIEQFRIAPSSASAISGLAGILFVGFGAFLGGTIIRLLNVNSKLMTRWIATSALLYCFGMLILMNLGCPQNQIVYHESSEFLSTDCSTNSKCSPDVYNPVCANGTTYMSPCLAGCKSYTISEEKIIYDECGCSPKLSPPSFSHSHPDQLGHLLQDNQQQNNLANDHSQRNQVFTLNTDTNLTTTTRPNINKEHLNLNVATRGHCLVNCDNLKWYIIIFSIFTLVHASCEVGSMMFNLRCVQSTDRTLALGLITFTSSLLGTIPCSVIYGTVIDLTCIHWDSLPLSGDISNNPMGHHTQIQGTSIIKGACRAYKNDDFRFYLHGVTAFVMFLAFLVDCIVSRRSKEVDFYGSKSHHHRSSSKEEVTVGLKSQSTETI